MKRLINVRIPLFCALGLILGIIACKELLCGDFYFGLILCILLVAGMVIGLIIKRGRKVFALVLWLVLIGFILAQLSYNLMEGDEVIGREVQLQGRVCDLNQNGFNGNTYYLENCVDLISGDSFRGKVKLRYFVYGDEQFEVGEVLTVRATMYSTYPVKTSVESFYLRNRIYYELVDAELESRTESKVKFDEKARRYVYEIAMEYAQQNGGIIYALLTGDRNAIPDEVKDDFTRAGAIHVLAVSGLHVGFVVSIICFALRRLKLKPLLECGIVLLPLIAYAYICGFSPSVTRAVVMTVCLYLSRVALGRYDLLTSLSISAIILVFLTPYSIFDVGFQLSFLSVFGIVTLHAPIMRLFAKRKLNKFVRYLLNAFLLSLSCSLATLFTMAVNFGQVPILGVFVNLIVIPLISVVFVLSVFGIVPWVFHYLLVPVDKILVAFVFVNEQVSSLSFATVSITALAVSVALAAVLMFIVGGFVNFNKIIKRIACAGLVVLLIATVMLAMIPRHATNRVYVTYGYYDTVIAATSEEGEAVIVGSFSDYTATLNAVQFLNKYRINHCTLFVTDYPSGGYSIDVIVKNLPINKAYTLTPNADRLMAETFDDYGIATVYVSPNTTVEGAVSVRSIYNGALAAVNVNVGVIDISYVTGNGEIPAFQLYGGADLYALATNVDVTPYSEAGATTFSRYQTRFAYNYGANKYGNFTIIEKDGKIILSFS